MKPKRSRVSPRLILAVLSLMILLATGALIWLAQPLLAERGIRLPFLSSTQVGPVAITLEAPADGTPEPSATPTPSVEPATPTRTSPPIAVYDPAAVEAALREQGVLVLSMREGYYAHLFAYHPLYLPLTRLTNQPWDDITPALSPDGSRLAYSSRQNGYWDLYLLDLHTGRQSRLTDTPEHESSPTWSPDGLWLAFDQFNGINQDIYILSLAEEGAQPIRLTDHAAADRAPAWSPQGREIAFVSNRTGDDDIWLARLDDAENRFVNLSKQPLVRDRAPVWSPDGGRLAWAAEKDSKRHIAVWDTQRPELPARLLAEGDQFTWSPDGGLWLSVINGPNSQGLAVYAAADGQLQAPYRPLPGALYGLTWVRGPLPAWLDERLRQPDPAPAPTLWQPVLTREPIAPAGRAALVDLPDVIAPLPMLQDGLDEAYTALRRDIAAQTGWDALSSLENAHIALTVPPTPSMREDWLYTGRAIALNPLLLTAGWMSIAREDFNGQTYWRVYLKTRYQDGSMGVPLEGSVWDVNARFNGDPRDYDQGGRPAPAPAGYWLDLTEMAARYGWERLPAFANWRTFYPAIRFNQFVMTGGLDWNQAMREVYPPEALASSTPPPTFTPTASKTPAVTPRPVTPTPSRTPTEVPTRRPTWTPLPAP